MSRVTFRRSDALAEVYGEAEDRTIEVDGPVQLTYGIMRETRDGDPIARLTEDGAWYIDRDGPYSDVLIES